VRRIRNTLARDAPQQIAAASHGELDREQGLGMERTVVHDGGLLRQHGLGNNEGDDTIDTLDGLSLAGLNCWRDPWTTVTSATIQRGHRADRR
jgi:hypothetical protein